MSTDYYKNQTLIAAGAADAIGGFMQVSNCQMLTMTVLVSVDATLLVSSFSLGGTNDNPLVSDFPVLSTGKLITVAPSGWVFTPATGLLVSSTPAIGTHEITIAYTDFPAWVRPSYDFTSGGGVVDARVIVSTWSV